MIFFRTILFTFSLFIFLSHCASKQALQHENFSHRAESLLKIDDWQSKGKMGLSFPYEGKTKLVSASYEWEHHGDDFFIRFYGPLGMGEFTLEKRPMNTVLTNHKGNKYYAVSPEALFEEHAGVEIPWTLISYWLKGVPAPDIKYTLNGYDDMGLPLMLLQSDWTVSYISWAEFDGQLMPGKIKILRDDMNATLVIRDWSLSIGNLADE